MKVIRAKSAGFCMGVERAIRIARKVSLEDGKKVYTDGPLIHNRQMMEKLTSDGIDELGDYESMSEIKLAELEKNSVIVVRAHGVSPKRRTYLKNLGMEFKDATCPDVATIAGKIKVYSSKGYQAIILGDPKHPEVIGLLGYASVGGYVVRSKQDIDNLPPLSDKVCMVSQSTMFPDVFEEISTYLKQKYPNLVILDTICGATKERQSEVLVLKVKGAQAIIVIGGKHSANTLKLAKVVENVGLPVFHIETSAELKIDELKKYDTIGVTAGASTPGFLIDEVCLFLDKI